MRTVWEGARTRLAVIGGVGTLFLLLALLPGSMTCALGFAIGAACMELDRLEIAASLLLAVVGFGGAAIVSAMIKETP